MKKYFVYEVKKNAYVLGALVLVLILLHVAPLLIQDNNELILYDYHLGILSGYAGVLALIAPMQLLRYKMRRRSVDLYYSLPLSHTKILFVRYLIGLIAVYLPYTVAYWLGAFVVMARISNYIDAVWYLPLYFSTLIPIYIIYSMSAFLFTRANKEVDGAMFILFWTFAVTLVVFTVTDMFNDSSFYVMYFFPFEPLDRATTHFRDLIYQEAIYEMSVEQTTYMAMGFTLTALLSIAATFGLFFTEKSAKAENAGQISDSWFGYRVMIPIYTVCLASFCRMSYALELFLLLLVATGAFFLHVLYKRTIKLDKRQLIVFGASLLVGIFISFI